MATDATKMENECQLFKNHVSNITVRREMSG